MCAVASAGGNINLIDRAKFQEALDDFYEEIFEELRNFGKLEDVQVCENLGDHMVGNVYVKYYDEEDAQMALLGLQGRYYAGRPMSVEFSPVTDFREARCRQFDEGTCTRGPYCNFMHVCEPSAALRKYLEKEYDFRGGKMKGTGGMDNLRNGGASSRGLDRGDSRGGARGERGPDRGDYRRDRGSSRDRDRGRGDSRDRGRSGRGDSRDRGRGDDRGDRDRRRRSPSGGRDSNKRPRVEDGAPPAANEYMPSGI